jgi:hypothetical protein
MCFLWGTNCTFISYLEIESCGSAVGIAIGYGQDDRGVGVRFLVGSRIISSYSLDRLLGSTSLICDWYRGACSAVIKRPGLEVDHSPLSGAEAEIGGVILPVLPHIFMASCLVYTVLGSTKSLMQWVLGVCSSGVNRPGAWRRSLLSNYYRGQENVDLHIHFPKRRHGVVLS